MTSERKHKPAFYVVQFIDLPFKGIDDYVCVPHTWVVPMFTAQKAFVTYPNDEDPSVTRDRVKRKENCDGGWRFYVATYKYHSDSYTDAEQWIVNITKYGTLVDKDLLTTDTQPGFPLNRSNSLFDYKRNVHSLKLNDNPRKPLPRISIKQPVQSKSKKQLDGKQLKLNDAAQSSSAVVTDAKTESNRERLIIVQNNQSMEYAQTDETTTALVCNESTEQRTATQRTEHNKEALSLPVIDQNEPLEVTDINKENPSQDTYASAEQWIAKRNNHGVLVEKESKTTDSKSIYNSQKPLPIILLKRLAPSELKKQLNRKRLKLNDAAQSSSAVDTDAKTDSNRERLVIVQNNQPMEYAQTDKPAVASNGNESTEKRTPPQRTKQNKQALSLPEIDVTEPPEVTDIDEENHSQGIKKPDKNNSQSHLVSNTTAVSMTAEEASTLSEQTTQPNQINNKQEHILDSRSSLWKFQPRIENVRSLANIHDDHEVLVNEVSNNTQSTSHETLSSFKKSDQLHNHMKGVRRLVSIQTPIENEIRPKIIKKDLAVAVQNPSNLMDHTASSSARSVGEQLSGDSENHSQDGLLVRETRTAENSKEQIGPFGSVAVSFEKTQHVPKINVKPHDMTFVDPSNVILYASNIATQGQYLMTFHKNPYHAIYQNNFQQDILREYKERIPSTGQNSTNPFNPLYLTSELPQHRRLQPNQLHNDLQHQPQIPKGDQRYACNITSQKKDLMAFHQNPYQRTYQNSFQQDLLRESKESNNYDYRPNSPTSRTRVPYTGQNSTNPCNPLDLTSERPQQRQWQPNQQDLQRKPQISKGDQRYACNITTQGKTLMAFHQNPYQPTYQHSFQQDLLRESKESNKYDHPPNSPTIRTKSPSTGQNSTNPSNPMYLTSEVSQERQSEPIQQDLQRQPQIPKGEQRYSSNIATQGKNRMAFHQNTHQRTCQNSFQQDLLRESKESNKYDNRPNSPTIRMRSPSTGQNSRNPSNPMCITSQLPQQRQSEPIQQDLQRQPQIPEGEQRYASNIATQGKNLKTFHQNTHQRTYQNSFQQDLLRESKESNKYDNRPNSPTIRMRSPSTGQNSRNPSNPLYLTSELPQQRQSQPNQLDLQRQSQIPNGEQRLQALQNHLNVTNNIRQKDVWMEEETHGVNSVSDAVTDHEVISDNEMSTDDEPFETTNNFYCNGITSGSRCVDKPIAAQNSTFPNHQTHPRVVLEQQMLDKFATLLIQMGCTLQYTRDMYNYLQRSIQSTAKLYEQLLGAVEDFNTAESLNSNASTAGNLAPEVSQSPVEKHIQVPPRANSSKNNQHSNDAAFVLPREYDPNDTSWTLKYRTHMPGLSELMPRSGIYVNYEDVVYCQRVSNDCKSLARRLLPVVFKRSALSVCLSMTEDNVGSNIRPELDERASIVLLNFVREHGLQRGWSTDLEPILDSLHSKIQKCRFKFGKRDQS